MRNSLVGVLMRFRTYLCALISDIRKLYYQCEVQKNQQDFLRFLWYQDNDFNKPIVKSKMTRLSFGLLLAQSDSAPYSTMRLKSQINDRICRKGLFA